MELVVYDYLWRIFEEAFRPEYGGAMSRVAQGPVEAASPSEESDYSIAIASFSHFADFLSALNSVQERHEEAEPTVATLDDFERYLLLVVTKGQQAIPWANSEKLFAFSISAVPSVPDLTSEFAIRFFLRLRSCVEIGNLPIWQDCQSATVFVGTTCDNVSSCWYYWERTDDEAL